MVAMLNPVVTDDQMIEAYQRHVSLRRAAAELGVSVGRMTRTLMRHRIERNGLEVYRKAAQRYSEHVQQEIARLHVDEGVSVRDLSRRFGGTEYAIAKSIERQGKQKRPGVTSRKRIDEDMTRRVCAFYDLGMSQMQIAAEVGFGQAVVSRVLREAGATLRNGTVHGEDHPYWKGGRWKTGNGYWRVWLCKDDPLASMRDRSGYVLEHRLVLARSLGRPLFRHETVHHKNGDPADNRLENLQLRNGRHGKGHAMVCLDCGSHNVAETALV